MSNLVRIVEKSVWKNSNDMCDFFTGLVKAKELYAFEFCNKAETGICINDGFLVPASQVGNGSVLLLAKSSYYHLEIKCEGGCGDDEGSAMIYNQCWLSKLREFDPEKIRVFHAAAFPHFVFLVPSVAELGVHVDHHRDLGYQNGRLLVEGEMDDLFEKVCRYVEGK